MLLTLMRSRSTRIGSMCRASAGKLKPTFAQRQHFGNQSISKAEVERDAYLFGDPTETASVEGGGDGESSIIYKHKTFVDMGVCPQLAIALKKTQKTIPTLIQKASFDSIVSKKDVVICAETGSGKTLSYLLPLLEQYYTGPKERSSLKYPTAVVLVPNKDLMGQVQRMAEEVIKHANRVPVTAEGEMAARVFCGCVERVDGHWPYEGLEEEPLTHSPDILICTPAFLGAFIKGPKITDEDLFYSIKRCIFDEADMLLEGSYKKDMEKILDAFKVLRRRTMKRLDLKPHERVVQFILSAATLSTHGKYSVDWYLQRRFPHAERVLSASFHQHHPRIEQDFLHVDLLGGGSGAAEEQEEEESKGVMTSARVELVFRALVGALPPRQEDEEEGGEEVWQKDQWRGSDDEPFTALDLPPTMVFANTAGKARDLAQALLDWEGGVLAESVAEFHKLVPTLEKQEALERFRNHSVSGIKILVCTDAAARGLDLPCVEHVIQAEFALNVVQHLHRNGRASRAGKQGRATVIFDDSALDLVQSVIGSGEETSRSIDSSFSRRRGFRKNVNRRLKRKEASQAQS